MRKVTDFVVDDLGIQNSQYFQGYGIACTEWENCCYGIGDNPQDALDDCLDQIGITYDIDAEDLEQRILTQYPEIANAELPSVCGEYGEDCEDIYYHVGIKWKTSKEGSNTDKKS